jgi:microcystin-dependent protein
MFQIMLVVAMLLLSSVDLVPGTNGGFAAPSLADDHSYVGEIRMFASEVPPAGWLECDGRSLPAADHPRLHEVIGNRFGSTAAGQFNLPDLRGRFVRGWQHEAVIAGGNGGDPDALFRTVPAGGPSYADGTNHVGTGQGDALTEHRHVDSGHTHAINGAFGSNQVAFGGGPPLFVPGTSTTEPGAANIGGPEAMPGTGQLRVSSESRPSNVYLMFCIRDDSPAGRRRAVSP